MKYSVIIPLYNEEDNFAELHQRVHNTLMRFGHSFEIIFVDDGSLDSTPSLISQLAQTDPNVVGIRLSRNFGQENAILAGLKCCRGEDLIILDGDLQDPPEFISDLIEEKNKGYHVVYAIKSHRKENFLKRGLTNLFYLSMQFLSKVEIPRHVGTFSIFSRAVAWNIVNLKENNKFVAGLRSYVGFKQKGIVYHREKRTRGESKSFFSLARMGLNAIFSFSILPLRIAVLVSAAVGVMTFIVLFVSMSQNSFSDLVMSDWIILFIFLQLILMLMALTVVCEYIGRIHEQVKRRPDYIIESITQDGVVIEDIDEIRSIENTLIGVRP